MPVFDRRMQVFMSLTFVSYDLIANALVPARRIVITSAQQRASQIWPLFVPSALVATHLLQCTPWWHHPTRRNLGGKSALATRSGGEGGIRTHEGREAPPVFKTGAFNRSATSPWGAQFPARARDCPARPPRAWPILMAAAKGGQSIGRGFRIVIHPVLQFVP